MGEGGRRNLRIPEPSLKNFIPCFFDVILEEITWHFDESEKYYSSSCLNKI